MVETVLYFESRQQILLINQSYRKNLNKNQRQRRRALAAAAIQQPGGGGAIQQPGGGGAIQQPGGGQLLQGTLLNVSVAVSIQIVR